MAFHALDEKHIAKIARIRLGHLEKRLARMAMHVDVSEEALNELAQAGFDPVFGARPAKRAIQTQIGNPLAREIPQGKFAAGDRIRVASRGGQIRFEQG